MIWLLIMAAFVFAVLWGVGLWQYACDEIATAFRSAWERLK
jgi:hypothetical protein